MGRLATAVALLVFLAVGCGGGTDTVTERTVIREGPTTTTTAPAAQPTTPTTSGAAPAAFTSPSGNIVCKVTVQEARCGILDFDYTPPPQPSSCTVPGWGHTVAVGTGGAAGFVCAGDPPANLDEPPLDYGQRVLVGPFDCKSTTGGVGCLNRRNGHGFNIAVQGVKAR